MLLDAEGYLESLRDGRVVWYQGERVADVTTHRAFRNAARSVSRLYAASGFFNRYNFQATVRLTVKLEFMCGLLERGLEATGTAGFRGVQAQLGELIAMRHLFDALTTAMATDPEEGVGGQRIPRLEYAATARVHATAAWHRVREIFELALAGAPIVTVSGAQDLEQAELAPLIERYFRGTGLDARERLKLFRLVWDALYSEFGGRHGLYERNYAGNADQQRLDTLQWARQRGLTDGFRALVDECLADYDLAGWRRGPWLDD